jgi:hypothetical protein
MPGSSVSGHSNSLQIGQTGVTEGSVYVEPFPPTGTKHLIAQQGGRPLWSRDGKELFFTPAPGRFMVVAVKTVPSFTITSPIAVPRGFPSSGPSDPRSFDITPDGRIVGVVPAGRSQDRSSPQIQVSRFKSC